MSSLAAEEAVRRTGHNVDSGVIELMVAEVYCVPVAALFTLAAAVSWRRGRMARYIHWFAVVWAVVPILMEMAGFEP
jgi:hypothetical protein